MSNFEKDEFNEVTYQIIQALLYKITDSLLSIFYTPAKNKLYITASFDVDKLLPLDRELMNDFEAEVKNRLPSYEVEVLIDEVTVEGFSECALRLSNVVFLRFNKLWW